MDDTLQTAYNVAVAMIGHKDVVQDEEIDKTIDSISHLYPGIDMQALKNELLANYTTTVDVHQILDARARRTPWLKQFRADKESNWSFWKRYERYLKETKSFPQASVDQIDHLTEDILDRLFNPQLKNIEINKKGMVVGQVQSGKTANYTGLICKAADAGFNFIIVLAGIHNNLRSQTQTRLDEGFLGFDTMFGRRAEANKSTKIGVGLIPGFKDAVANSITTSAEKGDFTRKGADSLGINFETPTPILLVIKKNISVLNRVLAWLHTVSPDENIDSKALLMVDDEADNASINTNKKEDDPTRINEGIRLILGKFSRSAYVGYTATPFANIFIPLNADDLFPRDFIINIPAPNNYIGPEKVFGTSVIPDDQNDDLLPIVNTIDDYEQFVPTGHKKNALKPTFDDIPNSLKTAMKCFILTCAIRIARGQGKKHNSMLIHVTRFQVWQNAIKELVEQLFNYYKNEIEADDPGIIEEFRLAFEEDNKYYKSYCTVTEEILKSSFKDIDPKIRKHSWVEIKPLLFKAVEKIEVKSINGSSADALTYCENEETGISVIAIGGDKLSRGLTLEGLSVSYFLRASKMYDTLMQMGRWFGYRPGYVDLCRLFTSPELNDWFRHITLASEELRAEFNYLFESGGTPDSYALKVRTHPGCLQITSLSKRRYTRDIQVSWSGRLVETYQLQLDKEVCKSNLKATNKFISKLGEAEHPTGHNECFLWRDISPGDICEYLGNFKVGKNLVKVNLEYICDYIRNLNNYGELTSWRVALMSKVNPQNGAEYEFSNGIKVYSFLRSCAKETPKDEYFIRKNHIVGNQQDEFIDIDKDDLEAALAETRKIKKEKGKDWKPNYPAPEIVRCKYRKRENPLLMIYPLDAAGGSEKNKHTDDPIIGLVMAFPSTSRKDDAVSYTVNQISEYAEDERNFDDENDNAYEYQ